MEDPHVDSWAALHLPAIEQLLLNLPDEEYRSTGVGDSEGSFFQSVVNTTPLLGLKKVWHKLLRSFRICAVAQ